MGTEIVVVGGSVVVVVLGVVAAVVGSWLAGVAAPPLSIG